MATIRLLAADRTAMATALRTAFDNATATGPCTIKFYTGAMPANGPSDAVTTQTLLGTTTCAQPLGSEAGGVLTFGTITQDSAADATGTAAWARLVDGNGVARADFDVSDNAGTGIVKVNTVTFVAGGPIQITSFTLTMGGA